MYNIEKLDHIGLLSIAFAQFLCKGSGS